MRPFALLFASLLGSNDFPFECAKRLEATEEYQEISRQYPRSLTVHGRQCRTIEWCPDNTCEGFRLEGQAPATAFMTFVYLYLHYLSDYYNLDEWRNQTRARAIARKILATRKFSACRRSAERDAAICALRVLEKVSKIRVFFVRYDEDVRSETPTSLPD
jgi:hypothetical protein